MIEVGNGNFPSSKAAVNDPSGGTPGAVQVAPFLKLINALSRNHNRHVAMLFDQYVGGGEDIFVIDQRANQSSE